MTSDLKFKLLQHLNKKNEAAGFTLIELLVVIIIIGILAAVALPNLLKQVGKSRETELKNAVGTVNRSQQSYHFDRQAFAPSLTLLGVSLNSKYIQDGTAGVTGGSSAATYTPSNTNATNDGTRPYSSAISYDSGQYTLGLCQGDVVSVSLTAPTITVGNNTPTCTGGVLIK